MGPSHAAIGGLVVNVVLPILAIIGVALRYAARLKKRQPLQADDWTILVSLVCSSLQYARVFNLLIFVKLLCMAIAANSIYAACTGLHGVPWDHMTLDSFRSFRKVDRSVHTLILY